MLLPLLAGLLFVGVLLLRREDLERQLRWLRYTSDQRRGVLQGVPLGALTHYDERVREGWLRRPRRCRRCQQGEIGRRRRFRIVAGPPQHEGRLLEELPVTYFCSACSYRGIYLRGSGQ